MPTPQRLSCLETSENPSACSQALKHPDCRAGRWVRYWLRPAQATKWGLEIKAPPLRKVSIPKGRFCQMVCPMVLSGAVPSHGIVAGMPRAGFGFVGPTCRRRAGLPPSPPDHPGLPERDLENENAWRSAPAEVAKQNAFGSLDRGNYRRSQTALFSDRPGGHHGDSIREVTVGGYWVSVTLLSRDEKRGQTSAFCGPHRSHSLYSHDHSLWRYQRTRWT
jgi:hypothetical protein